MHDQYGDDVPDDLVLLPDFYGDYADVIFGATWYERNSILMASASEIGEYSEDDPEDAGIVLDENSVVCRIPECLQRGSPEDGFYHA